MLQSMPGGSEIRRWRVGDEDHPWELIPVTGRLEWSRGWAVEIVTDDDGDGSIDEDGVELVDDDGDALINEDPVEEQIDNDGDGILNEDPVNSRDDDGDGLIDEDGPRLRDGAPGVTTWLVPIRLDGRCTAQCPRLTRPGRCKSHGTGATTTATWWRPGFTCIACAPAATRKRASR